MKISVTLKTVSRSLVICLTLGLFNKASKQNPTLHWARPGQSTTEFITSVLKVGQPLVCSFPTAVECWFTHSLGFVESVQFDLSVSIDGPF
jgi:hypothetical protein